MEFFKAIEYHQTRDFSRKVNATFEFIRQNFKPLSKAILVIAGPPVLILSMLLGSVINDLMRRARSSAFEGDTDAYFYSVSFWVQLALMCLLLIAVAVITISTINNYIVLYGERKTNKIEVADVWSRVRSTFWMYLSTTVLVGIVMLIAYVGLVIPMALATGVSEVLLFFGMIVFMCIMAYLIVNSSLVFVIRANENRSFFSALSRSFKLVRGKWWSTFGLIAVLSTIVTVISYLFIIPMYILLVAVMLHDARSAMGMQEPGITVQVMILVFFTVYQMLQILLYALPNVGIAFQYYNLVEMKEAKGLMSEIDALGQPLTSGPATSADEHY